MPVKNVQTQAKRSRENALREKRERKREKKAAAAARRQAERADGAIQSPGDDA
jgi:hypothetical protein